MIQLDELALDVGERPLLRHVNAAIAPGEFVAILGRNGAGKTTLLRAIAGLHAAAAGRISLDGSSYLALRGIARARLVAFVTADEALLEALLVRDVVSIGRFPYHRWWEWRDRPEDALAVDRALDAVGLSSFSDRLFSTLSAGERQRVWIALGLAQATPILLLDEPTSHLDLRVAHDILALLRGLANAGRTIVCALHDVNEAATYADRIALLGDGTLLAFAPPEAVLTGALLERTYGIEMERLRASSGRLRVFAREFDYSIGDAAGERRSPAPSE